MCSLSIICLVIAWANAGPAASRAAHSLCERDRRLAVGDHAVDEADRERALRIDHVAEEQQLATRAPSPTIRGSRYVTPMSAPRQPDLREDEAELRVRGGDPQVARARDHRARADRDAVDRRDDRPSARAHRLDQPTGRAREREQRRRVAPEQVLDDVVLVAAGAEAAAAPGDHDRAHHLVAVELLERLGELGVDLEGERVEALLRDRA